MLSPECPSSDDGVPRFPPTRLFRGMPVPDLEYHLDQVAGVVGTVATPGLE